MDLHSENEIKRIIRDNSYYFFLFEKIIDSKKREDDISRKIKSFWSEQLANITSSSELNIEGNRIQRAKLNRDRVLKEQESRNRYNELELKYSKELHEIVVERIKYESKTVSFLQESRKLSSFFERLKGDGSWYATLNDNEKAIIHPYLTYHKIKIPTSNKNKQERILPVKHKEPLKKIGSKYDCNKQSKKLYIKKPKIEMKKDIKKYVKKYVNRKSIKKSHIKKGKANPYQNNDLFQFRLQHQNFFYMFEQWSINHCSIRQMPVEERIHDYIESHHDFKTELVKYHANGSFTKKMHKKLDDILSSSSLEKNYVSYQKEMGIYKKKVDSLIQENKVLHEKVDTLSSKYEKTRKSYVNLEKKVEELSKSHYHTTGKTNTKPKVEKTYGNIDSDEQSKPLIPDETPKSIESIKQIEPIYIHEQNSYQTKNDKAQNTAYKIRNVLKKLWTNAKSLIKYN